MSANVNRSVLHLDARQHFCDELHRTGDAITQASITKAKTKAKIKLIAEVSYSSAVVVVVVLETCAIIPRDVVSGYVACANMAFH